MRRININNKYNQIKCRIVLSAVVATLLVVGGSSAQVMEVSATEVEEVDVLDLVTEDDHAIDVVEGEEFRVKFVNYDGQELYNEMLPSGTFIMEPEVPERIGFTFLGWAPEVDLAVGGEDVVYTAQFVETDGGYAEEDATDDVMLFEGTSDDLFTSNNGDFMNFVFMVILFLMETVWLHDRRSQQMRRYDAVMSMMDKE